MTSPHSALPSPPSPPHSTISSGHSSHESLRALELSESFPENSTRPGLGRHNRSSTITSLGGFDFQHTLLPLTPSGEVIPVQAQDEKHVGLLHGLALVVGAQVGSGIFSSPGVVVAEVGSVGASLLVWIISGLLAWTGASSFAELGCAIPLSGGAQAYLAYSFGPMLSYLYTFTAVSTLKPGSSAIVSLIFGEYVNRAAFHAISRDAEAVVPEWTFKITATIAIISVSVLNLISRSMGTNFSVVITSIKVGALLAVAILGLVYFLHHGAPESFQPQNFFSGTSSRPSNYAIALYSGLWAFDGWDQCNLVAGEMRNPERDLPRTLHGSMTIVLVLFVTANLSYFVVLAPETVASSNTVALDFGKAVIGTFGAAVFSTLVAVSCFGALNNGFFTTARLIYAASRENFLPSMFSKLHHRRRTPDNAMALQAGLALFYVIFGGGFRRLLNFFSVVSWTFYLLTVLGLLVLRVKEPHLERPYKTMLITPIIFCAVALFLLLMPIFAAPWEALAAFMFIFAGVPMYYITARGRAGSATYAHEVETTWRGTFKYAWKTFRDDVVGLLPGHKPQSRPSRIDEGSVPILRSEHMEMSERG
ncbi:L-methionine transporter [Tremella mesenterica]|uniref:L-methionine transporter n=1 Tax=Tremella mesenterica TaxID=5217 RepID=A0A4Q1B7Z3_TREME|nr:L-methionine transporter [Tremella mesenterica]